MASSIYLNMINLHTHFFSSRSKDIVEPLIKPQWYVDCQEMADKAVKVLKYQITMFTVDCILYFSSVTVHVWKTV